jgi:hypothetical protein
MENKKLPEMRHAVQEFKTVIRQGNFEKFQYAKKITDGERPEEIVDLWIRWVRAHGKDPQKTYAVLAKMLKLHALLTQPQFNHRLAVENFLMSI